MILVAATAMTTAHARQTLRVLAIGNSFTTDALGYMPWMMKAMANDVDLTLGLVYSGGYTLRQHWYNGARDTVAYRHFSKCVRGTRWVEPYTQYTCTLEQAVTHDHWDIILLQQGSSQSRDYGQYQPYLNYLINWLNKHVTNENVIYGWLLPQAWANGYQNLGEDTSLDMFADMAACAQRVLNETAVSFVIPCGTSIENARMTPLDTIGVFGHLSLDGMHLQEGIPCLLEAYVAAQTLLQQIGRQVELPATLFNVTQTWVINIIRPDKRGDVYGFNHAIQRIYARKCIELAMQSPFQPIQPMVPPLGDVNADYLIDVHDIKALQQIITESASPNDFGGLSDINGDGVVDVVDINEIITIITVNSLQ